MTEPPRNDDPALPGTPAPNPTRWLFLRDVVVFQLKLVLDALRDALLVPLSLIAAGLDLLRSGDGRFFYALLQHGRRSESWIRLFEAAERVEPSPALREGKRSLDDLVRTVEALAIEQHAKGGLTASAKEKVDRLLDALQPRRPE